MFAEGRGCRQPGARQRGAGHGAGGRPGVRRVGTGQRTHTNGRIVFAKNEWPRLQQNSFGFWPPPVVFCGGRSHKPAARGSRTGRRRGADGFSQSQQQRQHENLRPKILPAVSRWTHTGFPHPYHLIILERANFQHRRSDPVADLSGPPTERRPCGWCTPWGSRMISSSPTPGWRPSASSSSEVEGERWLVAVWSLKFVLPLLCCQLTCCNYLGFPKNTTFHCEHTHRIHTNLSPHIYRSLFFNFNLINIFRSKKFGNIRFSVLMLLLSIRSDASITTSKLTRMPVPPSLQAT